MEKFICSELTHQQRAEHYVNLCVRRLDATDLSVHDDLLLGQMGVFATMDLPPNNCIGVHGGTVVELTKLALKLNIEIEEIVQNLNQDYFVSCSNKPNVRGINVDYLLNLAIEKEFNSAQIFESMRLEDLADCNYPDIKSNFTI